MTEQQRIIVFSTIGLICLIQLILNIRSAIRYKKLERDYLISQKKEESLADMYLESQKNFKDTLQVLKMYKSDLKNLEREQKQAYKDFQKDLNKLLKTVKIKDKEVDNLNRVIKNMNINNSKRV